MTWGQVAGVPGLDPRTAAAAMALVTKVVEPFCLTMAFSHDFRKLDITRKDTLSSVISKINKIPMGGTNCALPMIYALKNNINVDAFVVYTDNETWYGDIHPKQALIDYRRKINPNAKLMVVAFTATKFSIADPHDPGMLDLAGFDSAAPAVMKEFVLI
jgi:60 kDa SS-A/Ro ribonucleoprotein